jgi:hypothetical protein
LPGGGAPGAPPLPNVEGDGISYSGIVWFVVILTVTTLVCQILMWVLLRAMQNQAPDAAMMASPMAPAVAERQAPVGRVYPDMVAIGTPNGPAPKLLVREPINLEALRKYEHETLTTYGVTDKNTGMYRIPIDRAKELLLERGLPVRGADAAKDVKTAKEVKK